MDLEKLKNEAFEIAKAHGWHDEELSGETYLMLIITEIAEAVQADRKDKYADVAKFKEYQTYYGTFLPSEEIRTIRFKEDFEEYIKNSVENELADVVIRCLDLAGLHDYDLSRTKAVSERNLLTIKDSLPKFAYRMCQLLTNEDDSLKERLNYCIASIIAYCNQKYIDIEWFVTQKMKYNKLRPYKHGNKRY